MELLRIASGWPTLVEHMKSVGYSDGYADAVGRTARKLVDDSPSIPDWDGALAWADGHSKGAKHPYMRAHLAIIRQYDELGVLPRTEGHVMHARRSARDGLGDGFARVLDAYESSDAAARKGASTAYSDLSAAATFFARLEERGLGTPDEVTEGDVLAVLTGPDGLPAYSAGHVSRIRAVLSAAAACGACPEGLAPLLPVPRRWRKEQPSLTRDESRAVAEALGDPSVGLCQRDRAIGCVLLYTGMRSCDVAALLLGSIDWRRDRIELVQLKTGSLLRLPLLAQVGNAIFDYVTGERGESDDPHVFLSGEWPYGALTPQGVRNVARLVLAAAGVRLGEGDARGTHLFRRGLATSMLSKGTDRAVAASVLGHASPATTDSYVSSDLEGLRAHASLDVSRFPVGGEVAGLG